MFFSFKSTAQKHLINVCTGKDTNLCFIAVQTFFLRYIWVLNPTIIIERQFSRVYSFLVFHPSDNKKYESPIKYTAVMNTSFFLRVWLWRKIIYIKKKKRCVANGKPRQQGWPATPSTIDVPACPREYHSNNTDLQSLHLHEKSTW